MSWEIIYYISPSGKCPVKEFIDSLEKTSLVKVYNSFELLSEFGLKLGFPHVKKVTSTPLWELRILGKSSLRFFYVALVGQKMILLHGFGKKKQKTPKKEIKTAKDRLKDFKAQD